LYFAHVADIILNRWIGLQNPQQFLSGGHEGEAYVAMFFKVVERTIKETNNREVKASAGLLTCFVECCHGLVDPMIPHVLQITYSVLEGMKSKSTSIKLMEVAMAIIHYNPVLALSLMSANASAMQNLFTTLFDLLPRMEDSSTQRLIVASFCAYVLFVVFESFIPTLSCLLAMYFQVVESSHCIAATDSAVKSPAHVYPDSARAYSDQGGGRQGRGGQTKWR
jgi:hypothetical protein